MASSEQVDVKKLHTVILYTEDGQAVSMKSLWKSRPAIFIFLRHFSCIACRAHVTQIWQHRFTLEQDGAKIHFIGNGSFREISKFKKEMGVENAIIFTDPSRRSYTAAGLRRGILPSIGPHAIIKGVGLLRQGFRQKHYRPDVGDLWQLGGVLVVNPDGKVRYHYVSQVTGDFPTAVAISGESHAPETHEEIPQMQLAADYSVR